MSAPTPGAGLADDAEQWLAGLTAVGVTQYADDAMQRQVGEWAAQVMVVPAEDVVAMLDAAAALIQKHGWAQGRYGWPETGFSVAGAVEWAAHVSGWDRRRVHHAERGATLCLQIVLRMQGTASLSEWNDDLRTDLGRVIALLAGARILACRIGDR